MSDLISKQAAIDAIEDVLLPNDEHKVWFKVAIKALPTVQPEQEHGHWEYNNVLGYCCPKCYAQAPFWGMSSTQNLSAYCPNCGCKMDEVE